MMERDGRIFLENGLELKSPETPLLRFGRYSAAQQRLAAQRDNIKVLDVSAIFQARAEARKAKRVEEAMARNWYLGLDPSESETGIEPEVKRKWFIDAPPNQYSNFSVASLATASGNKTGMRGSCLFKRPSQDPNLSAASVATASGSKAKVKGKSLLKRPREDLGDSSKTFLVNPSPAAESSATGDAANGNKAEVGGGSLLKRPNEDLGNSSETSVENTKPETDSSANLVASGNN